MVTNPPFSLFREYVAQLIAYNKKFLIIGNLNAITYKEIFPLIKDNKLWVGEGFNCTMIFKTAYPNTLPENAKYVRSKGYDPAKGFVKNKGVCWFTNLPHKKRTKEHGLNKNCVYTPEKYPKYDNYDAIEVGKVKDIPYGYDGVMGVPITFLKKYCPKQFEIIGLGIANLGLSIGVKPYKPEHRKYRKEIQKRGTVDGDLYYLKDGIVTVPYARILIRHKKQIQKQV